MNKTILGDNKDLFKWDYLNFLVKEIGYSVLNVVPMATSDGISGSGKSTKVFPASPAIQCFCKHLRKEPRSFERIRELSCYTKEDYEVRLHKPEISFEHSEAARKEYFSGIDSETKQILFLDPDIGFEPQYTENVDARHVKYYDIGTVWKQISDACVLVVFQHGNHRDDFDVHHAYIKDRLFSDDSEAISWGGKVDGIMFVATCKSSEVIGKVRRINHAYKALPRPVEVIPKDSSSAE